MVKRKAGFLQNHTIAFMSTPCACPDHEPLPFHFFTCRDTAGGRMDVDTGVDVGLLTRAFGELERSLDCYNWVLMNNYLQPKGV